MPIRTRRFHELRARSDDDGHDDFAFDRLHYLVAGLYLAAGAEAALGERRGDILPDDSVRWGPLIAAPVAALAHAARATTRGRSTRIAAQVMNGIAVAVGAIGLASSVASVLSDDDEGLFGRRHRSLRKHLPSLAPLAFGVTGVLGALLDSQEQEEAAERRRLERRARIVERLTPARKPRVDHIVIHV